MPPPDCTPSTRRAKTIAQARLGPAGGASAGMARWYASPGEGAIDRALDRAAGECGLERAHLGEALAGHPLCERAVHRSRVGVAIPGRGGRAVGLGLAPDRGEVEVRCAADAVEI